MPVGAAALPPLGRMGRWKISARRAEKYAGRMSPRTPAGLRTVNTVPAMQTGLPGRAEAVLLSVADVFVPPPVSEADDTFSLYVPPGVKRAHEHAARVLGEARALAAVEAVAARSWSWGSEARLVSVLDTFMYVNPEAGEPSVLKWVDAEDEKDWELVKSVFEPSAEKLRASGLSTMVELRKGNPKHVLVEEAEAGTRLPSFGRETKL